MPRRDPRHACDEGATSVETAIALSLFFLLIFGIIELGIALWQWNTMLLAVEQAGRYAIINNATITLARAESQMQAVLSSASISCPLPSSPPAGTWHVCAAQNTGTSPQTMTLSAAYGYSVIGLAGPFKITSHATVPLD